MQIGGALTCGALTRLCAQPKEVVPSRARRSSAPLPLLLLPARRRFTTHHPLVQSPHPLIEARRLLCRFMDGRRSSTTRRRGGGYGTPPTPRIRSDSWLAAATRRDLVEKDMSGGERGVGRVGEGKLVSRDRGRQAVPCSRGFQFQRMILWI